MHKILLVDDMRRFLDLERSFLKRAECRILTAFTGLEAIKVAKFEIPDIIMLDVEMPEMNGIEACRILKNDPQTKHIPVVIYTALDNIEEKARQVGCDGFHRKPLDEEKFLKVIQGFVPLKVRKHHRVRLDRPVVIRDNESEHKGTIVDISPTGLFFKSDFSPVVGSLLELLFALPLSGEEKRVSTLAYSVRQDTEGTGCAFYDLSTGAELYIQDFVKHHVGKDQ
jgi:CheY-like chemotaxis protein